MLGKLKEVLAKKSVEAYNASEVDKSACKFNFTATNMRFNKVEGFFAKAEMDIVFNIKDLDNSFIKISWPVEGIRTGIADRDKQLIEAEHFFNANEHPNIYFESKQLTLEGKKQILVLGTLEIKGIKKEIALYMGYTLDKYEYQLFVDYSLDRFEFQIGENGSFSIGRQIELALDITVKL